MDNPCADIEIPSPPVGHIAADDSSVPGLRNVPPPDGYAWLEMGAPVDPDEHPELAAVLMSMTGAHKVPDFRGRMVLGGAAVEPGPVHVLIRTRS